MNYTDLLARYSDTGTRTRASLIGVGQFGRTLLLQSLRMPGLELCVLCDLDIDRLKRICLSVGLAEEDLAVAETGAQAARAMEAGKLVLTVDSETATDAPVDVVVEATGDGEAGARNCMRAIDQGRHITLVTKETDSVVGPLLTQRAARHGLVVSQVDGDQPSLLLGLMSWAENLGLEIACAGKASEYDFVYDPASGTTRAEGVEEAVQLDAGHWTLGSGDIGAALEARAQALAALPQRTPPDYCEMCIVANASGLKPDEPRFHAPVARLSELAEIFRSGDEGGVLSREGCLDIFNCFRRPDEVSAAGGVFVVLRVPDAETGRLFAAKGMPMNRAGTHLLAYNPTHLLGVEAGLSVVVPHRLGLATGSTIVTPVCDVIMCATKDLAAGTVLSDHGHHHRRIDGVEAQLADYTALKRNEAVPYFLAAGCVLGRDVRAGEIILPDAVKAPDASVLWRLRAEQDDVTFPSRSPG